LIAEWIALLVSIIKHGYFMSNGVREILREMIRVDYVPSAPDFPTFMDETSIGCFLKIYYEVKNQELNKK
jgi:hypothetical protein